AAEVRADRWLNRIASEIFHRLPAGTGHRHRREHSRWLVIFVADFRSGILWRGRKSSEMRRSADWPGVVVSECAVVSERRHRWTCWRPAFTDLHLICPS